MASTTAFAVVDVASPPGVTGTLFYNLGTGISCGNGSTNSWTGTAIVLPIPNSSASLPNMQKGDLLVFNGTTNSRLPIGVDGQFLSANSTLYPGLTWTTLTPTSVGLSNINSVYRTILEASASHTAGQVAGTYALSVGNPAAVSGTGTLFPLSVVQIVAADYPSVNNITPKLRLRTQLYTNDTAPTGNFTFGLYPITRPATTGGAGVNIFTLGTVVAGSNGAVFTAPVAKLLGSAVGSDFALPSDGPYVIGVVTTGTIATLSHVHMCAQLQMRNA